jgi:hypothetical protein
VRQDRLTLNDNSDLLAARDSALLQLAEGRRLEDIWHLQSRSPRTSTADLVCASLLIEQLTLDSIFGGATSSDLLARLLPLLYAFISSDAPAHASHFAALNCLLSSFDRARHVDDSLDLEAAFPGSGDWIDISEWIAERITLFIPANRRLLGRLESHGREIMQGLCRTILRGDITGACRLARAANFCLVRDNDQRALLSSSIRFLEHVSFTGEQRFHLRLAQAPTRG